MSGLIHEEYRSVPVEVEQIDTIIGWVKEGRWTVGFVQDSHTGQMCMGGMIGKVLYDDPFAWPDDHPLFKLIENAVVCESRGRNPLAYYNNTRQSPDEVVAWLERAREAALAKAA